MQDDSIVKDCGTETTLIMETTVPTTGPNPSIGDNTTALNSSLLLPDFDDKENDCIPVDNLGIYSEVDHQRLEDLLYFPLSWFSPKFLIHSHCV